jgi:hypothetical protein
MRVRSSLQPLLLTGGIAGIRSETRSKEYVVNTAG